MVLLPRDGDPIRSAGRNKQRVGASGNGLQLAANAKGGHGDPMCKLRSDFARLALKLADLKNTGIYGTTNGKKTYSKYLNLAPT